MVVRRLLVALFGVLMLTSAGYSQTVKVLVMQEDWDQESLERDNRIQRAALIAWQKVLNAPSYQNFMQQFGLGGLDVYDETAVSMNFYDSNRTRRQDEELIQLARQISSVKLDAIILYTLYARAVEDPYTKVALLQAAMQYRLLDVKSGRFLGGDTVDIDTAGMPFTGCAANLNGTPADPHCVKEFVAKYAERMAEDAANRVAMQVGALLGRNYGNQTYTPPAGSSGGGSGTDMSAVVPQPGMGGGNACANIPTSYVITFTGINQNQMNAIEEYMASWQCAIDMDVQDQSMSMIRFEYKTRADQGRILRNIRLMSELMGMTVEPTVGSPNLINVEAFQLRSN